MRNGKVRFAVVGLGNIAQKAILPAFQHARRRCVLAALVSSDSDKLGVLSRQYGVEHSGSYEDLEAVLDEANVDAVYLAIPNSRHREFTERCARAGRHVLCEKPLAMSVHDSEAMISACRHNRVKLMVAYRLHFDPATLQAIDLARSGRLGRLVYFSSTFSHFVREGDIRRRADLGGGALFDMGIYCVNTARNLFGAEPESVLGLQVVGKDGVDQTTLGMLYFPDDRLAEFTACQAASDVDAYRVVGAEGSLRVEPAYSYSSELTHHLCIEGKPKTQKFAKSDQFAPELLHFAECIQDDMEPEPSGEEGLADVRILEAMVESARLGRTVKLEPFTRARRPGRDLEMRKPPVREPKTVHAPSPSR